MYVPYLRQHQSEEKTKGANFLNLTLHWIIFRYLNISLFKVNADKRDQPWLTNTEALGLFSTGFFCKFAGVEVCEALFSLQWEFLPFTSIVSWMKNHSPSELSANDSLQVHFQDLLSQIYNWIKLSWIS